VDNSDIKVNKLVIKKFKSKLPIKYVNNGKNIGSARNILKSVSMSSSEFAWIIGDDDMIMPMSLKTIKEIINKNSKVDFFYVNSFCMNSKNILKKKQIFNTHNIPKNLKKFSDYRGKNKIKFLELINTKVSFDLLGGQFLSLFRVSLWRKYSNILSKSALKDMRIFSHLHNTFPHTVIFANAFKNKNAFFVSKPMSVNLFGNRGWETKWPLVKSIRLIELLDYFRLNGINFFTYLRLKNELLDTFLPDFFYLLLNKKKLKLDYLNFFKIFLKNIFFINFYLSFFYYILRKIK
tara:strand:- start:7591 stop:8466 length:876 start_codon:yes stop_codon:yes gene_type:complete